MKKLILMLLIGIFLITNINAEIYKTSISTSFAIESDNLNSAATNSILGTTSGGFNFIWLGIGVIIFLVIVYILFKKPKKSFKKKKL